jgi:hypothetical protein
MLKDICELLWLRKLLIELEYPTDKKISLFCDNKSVIAIAQNPIQYDSTKYIKIDRYFIKENLTTKLITFPFVNSGQQLADNILPKPYQVNCFMMY